MDLLEYQLADGQTVTLAVAESARGPVTRGSGRVAMRATETFERSLDGVRSAGEALIASLAEMSRRPDSIEIEFGIEFSAEAGAFISAVAAGANFKVSLTWDGPTSA